MDKYIYDLYPLLFKISMIWPVFVDDSIQLPAAEQLHSIRAPPLPLALAVSTFSTVRMAPVVECLDVMTWVSYAEVSTTLRIDEWINSGYIH